MKKDEIKRFVKKHKAKIITGTIVIGGTILMAIVFKRFPKKDGSNVFGFKDILIPNDLKELGTSKLWMEKGYMNAIIENVPITDIGTLGETFIANGLAQSGDITSMVIGIERKN